MYEIEDNYLECTLKGCDAEPTDIFLDAGVNALLCKKHAKEYNKKVKTYRAELLQSMHEEK